MDDKQQLDQELADLSRRIKEIGKKCHKKELRETWERACRQMLRDISDDFLKNAHRGSYNDEAVFLAIGETIQNFPIPEYRDPEQKETE